MVPPHPLQPAGRGEARPAAHGGGQRAHRDRTQRQDLPRHSLQVGKLIAFLVICLVIISGWPAFLAADPAFPREGANPKEGRHQPIFCPNQENQENWRVCDQNFTI